MRLSYATIEKLFISGVILLFFLPSAFNWITHHYVDLQNQCIIEFKNASFATSLSALKHENFAEYHRVCRYIKSIAVDYCYDDDGKDGSAYSVYYGCYIKGSKLVMFPPTFEGSIESALVRYAQLSEKYWLKKSNGLLSKP